MTESTNYERISELIVAVEGFALPAQLHGALCGHLCAGGRWNTTQFITHALDLVENNKAPGVAEKKEFQWLYLSTLASLEAEEMTFFPAIPGNEESLSIRIHSLINWISAFLTGFGSSGQNFSTIPDEVKEVLQDMADICQVEVTDDQSGEDDWFTILEHVRLGAVHLFLAYNEPPKKPNDETKTH